MTWVLRRAAPEDLEAIMAIETATFPTDAWSARTMAREIQDPNGLYVVAVTEEGAIDGYAGLLAPIGAEDADIQTLAVVEAARRRGVGRALMLALLAEADRRAAARVFLEVRADNAPAQELYRNLGFEEIGIRRGYYQPDGVDAVVMRRTSVPGEQA